MDLSVAISALRHMLVNILIFEVKNTQFRWILLRTLYYFEYLYLLQFHVILHNFIQRRLGSQDTQV